MAEEVKVTDLDELGAAAPGDKILIVDISDTTDGPQGTSKWISKDNLVSQFNDSLTKFITRPSLSIEDFGVDVSAGEWIINGVNYTNSGTSFVVNPAASGQSRIDLIIADSDGEYKRIQGIESASNPGSKPLPLNTLLVSILNVSDSLAIEIPSTSISDLISSDSGNVLVLGTDGKLYVSSGGSVPDATESVKGKAQLATESETITGTNDNKIVTPLKLKVIRESLEDLISDKEDSSNKTTTFTGNETSNINFPTVKAIVDYFSTSRIKTLLGQASSTVDGWLSSTDWNTFNNKQNALGYTPENTANKGTANGYAPLNSSTKIDTTYLPDSILGQLLYGGVVNLTTVVATLTNNAKSKLGTSSSTITLTNNTTAITGYAANEGIYYIATVAGTFAGISFEVGDWLVSIGSAWVKIDNTDAIVSFNSRTGAITLTISDVTGALGYTPVTNARTVNSKQLNADVTLSTSDIGEGTNLYFTTARVLAAVLTGLSLATGGAIVSTDTVLVALGKIQKQITDLTTTKQDKSSATTGAVISFVTPQVYNSVASPSSSNITNDLTGATIGVIQKIYHNNSSTPTFPAGWVKLGSGTYLASTLNVIYCEWVSGSRVEYWIVQ